VNSDHPIYGHGTYTSRPTFAGSEEKGEPPRRSWLEVAQLHLVVSALAEKPTQQLTGLPVITAELTDQVHDL
jgi:hypothetical protein